MVFVFSEHLYVHGGSTSLRRSLERRSDYGYYVSLEDRVAHKSLKLALDCNELIFNEVV